MQIRDRGFFLQYFSQSEEFYKGEWQDSFGRHSFVSPLELVAAGVGDVHKSVLVYPVAFLPTVHAVLGSSLFLSLSRSLVSCGGLLARVKVLELPGSLRRIQWSWYMWRFGRRRRRRSPARRSLRGVVGFSFSMERQRQAFRWERGWSEVGKKKGAQSENSLSSSWSFPSWWMYRSI